MIRGHLQHTARSDCRILLYTCSFVTISEMSLMFFFFNFYYLAFELNVTWDWAIWRDKMERKRLNGALQCLKSKRRKCRVNYRLIMVFSLDLINFLIFRLLYPLGQSDTSCCSSLTERAERVLLRAVCSGLPALCSLRWSVFTWDQGEDSGSHHKRVPQDQLQRTGRAVWITNSSSVSAGRG